MKKDITRTNDSVFLAKSRKGYHTRRALFDAALRLVAEHGMDGFSVGALCEQAGIKRTAFYNYFQGVEELIDELSRHEDTAFDAMVERRFGRSPHGPRRLAYSLLWFCQYAGEHPTWNRSAVELLMRHQPTRTKALEDFGQELAAGIEQGDLQVEPQDLPLYAELVLSAFVSLGKQIEDQRMPDGAPARVVRMLLKAGAAHDTLIDDILANASP